MLITYLYLSSTALTTRKVSYKDIILVGAKKICNQNISIVSYLFESQLTVTPYIIADRIVVAYRLNIFLQVMALILRTDKTSKQAWQKEA